LWHSASGTANQELFTTLDEENKVFQNHGAKTRLPFFAGRNSPRLLNCSLLDRT
jgi:hypothetical protein